MKSYPKLIFLATERPVNLPNISHELLKIKKENPTSWISIIEDIIEQLLDMKKCKTDAANIHVSLLRALSTQDVEQAVEIGLKYVDRTKDERTMKTTVNLLLSLRRNQDAWELLQSFNDSKWSLDKREEILRKDGLTDDYENNFLDLIGRNELEIDHRPAILIYGDVNMNIIDGSSVWLASIAEAFADTNVEIHLLLKNNIERDILLQPLNKYGEIKIIEPKHFGIKHSKISPEEAVQLIEILDGIYGGYRSIIIRGLDVATNVLGKKSLWKRVYPYLTDYYFIKNDGKRINKVNTEEIIPDLGKFAGGFLIQTKQIMDDLEESFGINPNDMTLLPPMIPDIGIEEKENDMISLVKIGYSGKIAPLWGITELINSTRDRENIEIHIIGDKIHSNTAEYPNFVEEVTSLLEDSQHVIWHGGMSRTESIEIMKNMDVSWCYRSPILESNTLELSTKLIENTRLGIPSIVTRNQLNEEFFGNNYPLFVSNAREIESLLIGIDEILENFDYSDFSEKSTEYQISNVRKNRIIPFIDDLFKNENMDSKRIVLNGHDLKFIGEFESYLKIKGHQVKRDNWGWGEPLDIERSKSLLKWADVIFSEWGLANSVWYSNNKNAQQKHVVRIHLQEINERAKGFPLNIESTGVDNFIFVAEHVRDVAISEFNWEENKCLMIPNFVDVDRLNQDKLKSSKRTIGIIGVVPQRKRLDRALNLMKIILMKDPSWKLVIKGKDPRNIEFMKAPNRAKEMEYYKDQFNRIESDPILKKSVSWDGYSTSIASWYRKIGFVLSPSDFESFHYSIADGVSSGAIPVIWPWEGAKEIYTGDWLIQNTEDAADYILNADSGQNVIESNRQLIKDRYGTNFVFSELEKLM